ncbi:MAG TPA: glycoside hydrolase family 125 protein, partial [Arachidicoccus sp.]|nr:glycoside hydrolase family 125 protein [Arachidicoccus sp.]
MHRRKFLQQSAMAGAGVLVAKYGFSRSSFLDEFPVVRVPVGQRKFKSEAVESLIREINQNVGNKEIAWLFNNCFPNTLDTTVDYSLVGGKPDTFVITGDIDAMWLRDSTAQVTPYLSLCKKDKAL